MTHVVKQSLKDRIMWKLMYFCLNWMHSKYPTGMYIADKKFHTDIEFTTRCSECGEYHKS